MSAGKPLKLARKAALLAALRRPAPMSLREPTNRVERRLLARTARRAGGGK